MLNTATIKALTFDTGGTILDWHSGFSKGFEELRIKYKLNFSATEFANLMRKKSLEKVTTQNQNSLINFDIAHQQAVEEIVKENKLEISNEEFYNLYYITPSNRCAVANMFLAPSNP